ncbi:MAG: extracellular solute-binding protein [Pseudomonadota bacterium]
MPDLPHPRRRTSPIRGRRRWLAALLLLALWPVDPAQTEPSHAIAMHGLPKHPAGFQAFSYVDPAAPKGGRLVLGATGSFDSLNPLIVKGTAASGVRDFVVESLMTRGLDEPFTLYGLLAERIEVPDDRGSVTFHIDPAARFSDGTPVTSDDVLFSLALLRDKGRPNHRTYYKKVAATERLSERSVRLVLDGSGDREMPLILALMPILPRHKTDPATFEETSLQPPVGSGPYRIARVDAGRAIVYERDPGYWGKDRPVNRGRFNFDEIRFEYFRDGAALLEAFKNGEIDFRSEEDPAQWAEGYDIPAVKDGRIVREEMATGLPAGMTALAFNTRRKVLESPGVRRALIHLFDFEWINRNLYHSLFTRTESYFARSMLASSGRPADERERQLLAPFPGAVRPDIMAGTYSFPKSDGSGQNRANWREAMRLLGEAGYRLDGGKLVEAASGKQLSFEILAGSPGQERLLARFAADLARLGIEARLRIVDSAQYQARLRSYDYDMIQTTWPASLSPGNEQLFRWSSAAATTDGTFNFAGVRNPAADAMIAELLAAKDSDAFVSAVRALDRVLLSGDYVIPLFHLPRQWIAYWRHLQRPATTPLYGYSIDTWWSTKSK